jgi:hypothetical protein
MFKNEISQPKKVILFTLLIVLNIVLRIPSIPHEKGLDSFFIHSLSNSVTDLGFANWWIHWLSVFGYYPYSYASAVPFSLSGISQLTGMETEGAILFFCICLGLFSIFSVYILAGLLYDDFLFKYLMALVYSLSPAVMFFTTWEISSRGPFIIFLPVFIYLILKNLKYEKKILLAIVMGIFLFSVHHLGIIILPITMLFIFINLVSKIRIAKIKSAYLNYIYAAALVTVFMMPFFNPSMAGIIGSRYGFILRILTICIRFIGPIVFFVFSGLIYLIFKNDKKVGLWYFMCIILVFLPIIYNQLYGIYIMLLFLVIPLTVGFRNLLNIKGQPKVIGLFMIVVLIIFVAFTGFYNHYRTSESIAWYMDEDAYTTGEWIDHNINKEKRVLFLDQGYYNARCIALQKNGSSIIIGDTQGLAYGFVDKEIIKNNLEKVPISDSYFFSESPYKMTVKDKYNSINWFLVARDVNTIKEVYNLDYIVQWIELAPPAGLYDSTKGKIFSNGFLDIYRLNS